MEELQKEENSPFVETKHLRSTKASLEAKMDQLIKYIDKTMNTWMMIVTEIRDENSKMNQRITNIEKDIRYLKNRKTESVVVSSPLLKRSDTFVEHPEETSIGMEMDSGIHLSIKEPSYQETLMSGRGLSSAGVTSSMMKMESKYKMVESATIQMPRQQFQKMVQMTGSSEGAIQTMLTQQNGSIFTAQQQHFQRQQQYIVAKSQSTPVLSMIGDSVMIRHYRDVKVEKFEMDNEFVKKCMEINSIQGDIKMFHKMYLEGVSREFYPIRQVKKMFQYWLNGHMHDDAGGFYIKNTIARNIEMLYMKLNVYEKYEDKVDKFMNNQEHICKLSDEKYKDKLLQQIGQMISI
jgi:hypothetical protein